MPYAVLSGAPVGKNYFPLRRGLYNFDRGSRPGKTFTYSIRGAEMFVSSRSKSITRSTILYAYRKVKGKEISGPKAIGVHGDSYIYLRYI